MSSINSNNKITTDDLMINRLYIIYITYYNFIHNLSFFVLELTCYLLFEFLRVLSSSFLSFGECS